MPAGQNLAEEATFVGYFLKLNPYEDHEGVRRATPLLIGRLVWHPTAESPLSARAEWEWLPLAGVALVALLALRVWGRFAARRARSRSSGTEPRLDEQAVSAWLEGAEHRATADDERDGRDETARNGK
jgi:hypothetical protein